MVEFIKTCDQYPRTFNFGNFLVNSIILTPFWCRKNRSSENAVKEEWVLFFCLGVMITTWGRFLIEGMSKNEQVQFFDSQIYLVASDLNTINLKLFPNHGGIYMVRKKFKKDSGEKNPLGVQRNMRRCIFGVNCKGLGW